MRFTPPLVAAAIATVAIPKFAFAANGLVTFFQGWNDVVAELPGLVTGFFFVVGLVFVGLGLLALKRHGDDPDRYPQGKAWWSLGAGGLLCVLTLVAGMISSTADTGGNQLKFNKPPSIRS